MTSHIDLESLIQQMEQRDGDIQAFIGETDRLGRLRAEQSVVDAVAIGPLRGQLVGVKDLVNVEGLPTRAGSKLPSHLFAGPEATVVRRLRRAGAMIAGKTSTTEFAFVEPPPTRNPRAPGHTPGGSSTGSAAAVAAGMVAIAVGTQTVDSIVTPASYCGVIGFKPSYGRVPLDGVLACSPSMDHVGVLASSVEMASQAASVICDDWSENRGTDRLKIGIPGDVYLQKADQSALEHFEERINHLAGAGIGLSRTEELEDIDRIIATHRKLTAAEFATLHSDWFFRYGDRYRPRTAAFYSEGSALSPEVIDKGRRSGTDLRRRIHMTMEDHGIDVWAAPAATGPPPPGLDYIGDPAMSVPWTHAHLPVVAMPSGSTPNGLPLGIQLVGRLGHDEELLAMAEMVSNLLAAGQTG